MDVFSLVLVIIGALNWLMVGLFKFDLVSAISGGTATILARIIYSLIGLAGLWCIRVLIRTAKSKGDH